MKSYTNCGIIAVVLSIIGNFLSIAQTIIGKKLSIIGQGLATWVTLVLTAAIVDRSVVLLLTRPGLKPGQHY